MTIGKRLFVLLAVPLVALLVSGILARIQLSRSEERSRFVADSQFAVVAAVGTIYGSFAEIRVNARDFLLATDQSQRAAARAAFDANERALARLLEQYGDSLVTELSRLEDRIVAFAERDVDLPPADREILRGFDLSIEDLRSGRVTFARSPNELRLRKRAEAIVSFDGTSPTSGFGAR